MMTDPVADLLTRIRNANQALLDRVDIPASKLKVEIARLLRDEGFIRSYRVLPDQRQGVLRVYMKYGPNNLRLLRGLRRVSRPGLRVYTKADRIPRVQNGLGVAILSTSHGVMTGEEARGRAVGGEVLAYVW
jgi:small subunit ribosomal protein S8